MRAKVDGPTPFCSATSCSFSRSCSSKRTFMVRVRCLAGVKMTGSNSSLKSAALCVSQKWATSFRVFRCGIVRFVCFVMLLHLLLLLLHTTVVPSGQPYGLSPDKIRLPAAQDRALSAAVVAAEYIRPRETDCRNFSARYA